MILQVAMLGARPDDDGAVADMEVLLAATLTRRLRIESLVEEMVDPEERPGAAHGGAKVMTRRPRPRDRYPCEGALRSGFFVLHVPAGHGRLAGMEVRGIRWVGVSTTRMAEMRAFAIEVLGLRVAGQDAGDFVELAMADGAKLELFGSPEVADGPWVVRGQPVVAGFLVDDIRAARDELARAPGVELLGELRVLSDGYA